MGKFCLKIRCVLLALDWAVICAYLLGLLALSFYLSRNQNSAADYFLGGRRMSPSALAASTIATQCSTNSLLGAPAFVGFVTGGGMIWLQYELAVPLAMLALLWLMLPARRYGITSVYEILEIRLGRHTRLTAAACFLLFRGVATGVTIYGSALVISLILELDMFAAVLLIMTGTLVYDYLAGMSAVVISDVIQLILLLGAVVFSLLFIGDRIDWQFLAVERKQTLINDWGFTGQDYGFWPMLIGGIFLYAAYYGCDQSQAQRILATRSETDTAKVLLWNGIFRFPIVLMYCFLGLGLAVLATQDPLIVGALPETSSGEKNLNLVFPVFVLRYFDPGFIGLIMVGLIAASMSSIDSALNSLSAVTVEDFIRPHFAPDSDPKKLLLTGRLCTLLWGLFAVIFAFQVEHIAPTVLETVNKVGSMVNGPLLALICSAVFLRGLTQPLALLAFGLGLTTNLLVAFYLPAVSWLWWNVVGFVTTSFIAAVARKSPHPSAEAAGSIDLSPPPRRFPPLLLTAFFAILGVCLALQAA